MSDHLEALSNAITIVFWALAMTLYARGWRIEVHRPAPKDKRPDFVREAEDSGDANGTWRRRINGGNP